jgi:hypothetical protein
MTFITLGLVQEKISLSVATAGFVSLGSSLNVSFVINLSRTKHLGKRFLFPRSRESVPSLFRAGPGDHNEINNHT